MNRVLDSFSIPYESKELKDAKVAIGSSGDDEETEDFLLDYIDVDEYGEFKYADFLVEKNLDDALEYMRDAWHRNKWDPENYWAWSERYCNALEKAGKFKESCDVRVEILGCKYLRMYKIDENAFFAHMDKLKENSPKNKWPKIEAKLVEDMRNHIIMYNVSPYKDVYIKYLRREKKHDEFYKYLEATPLELDEYYDELYPFLGSKLHALFEEFIKAQAGEFSSAKSYDRVCAYLKKYNGRGIDVKLYRQVLIEKFYLRKMLVEKLKALEL
jgi:hypothetical protein